MNVQLKSYFSDVKVKYSIEGQFERAKPLKNRVNLDPSTLHVVNNNNNKKPQMVLTFKNTISLLSY